MLGIKLKQERKIAVLLAGGGFWGELSSLLPNISESRELITIIPDQSLTLRKIVKSSKYYKVSALVPNRNTGLKLNIIMILKIILTELIIIIKEKPVAVVGLGSNDCLPLAIASKLSRTPFVFIESVTRVDDISKTGKFIYKYRLASRFYVQWERLTKNYPRAVYRGITNDIRNSRDYAF